MLSFILSTALLIATVAALGGWMIRKERRLREEAETMQGLEAAMNIDTGKEARDAADHRFGA